MANPSLQIGNSNWAIKEDNLLGYSTAGTRFVPQPITMTRESAGTRVNSSGLVETVELLGSELVTGTNSDMSGANSWVGGLGSLDFNINTTVANKMWCNFTTSNQQVTLLNTLTAGKTYFVSLTARLNSGTATTVMVGGFTSNQASNAVFNIIPTSTTITYTGYITADNTSLSIGIITANNNGSDYEFDNVSVKESTKNNLARVDYDGTASSLLVEPERINLVTTSEDFDSYRVASSTVTPNSITAPDGTNSGILVTQGTNQLVLRANNVVAPSTTYTFSGYFKSSGSVTQVALDITDNGSTTFGLTSEWQRFSMTTESRGDGSPYHFVDVATNGIQGDTFYAWGLQVEQGSYPTSYIPTDGGTVTRVQDQYSKTGISNLINSEEGVLFLEMAALADDGTNRVISLSDGTSSNRVLILYQATSNLIRGQFSVSGQSSITINKTVDTTQFRKIAINWNSTSVKLYVDGLEIAETSTGYTFAANTLNKLAFDNVGSGDFFGKVKQLQVFKTALTDSELIALTTI